MSNEKVRRIQKISGIVLSALLVVVGILLIISCVSIYLIGNRPFTPENIGAAFARIQIPVYIVLVAVVAVVALHLVWPPEKEKAKGNINPRKLLATLTARLDRAACDEASLTAIDKERDFRRVIWIAAAVSGTVAAVPAFVYLLNFAHFTDDLNNSVLAAALFIIPSLLVGGGLSIAAVYLTDASIKRQIEALKKAIASGARKASAPQTAEEKPRRNWVVFGIRMAVLALAAAFLLAGIFGGGMADVLAKAINICTECIGLG